MRVNEAGETLGDGRGAPDSGHGVDHALPLRRRDP